MMCMWRYAITNACTFRALNQIFQIKSLTNPSFALKGNTYAKTQDNEIIEDVCIMYYKCV